MPSKKQKTSEKKAVRPSSNGAAHAPARAKAAPKPKRGNAASPRVSPADSYLTEEELAIRNALKKKKVSDDEDDEEEEEEEPKFEKEEDLDEFERDLRNADSF